MVGHDGHRGWVYYVAVDPDHRYKGYGRAIMNAAEDWLRQRGIQKLQLHGPRRQRPGPRLLRVARLSTTSNASIFAKWLDGRAPTP